MGVNELDFIMDCFQEDLNDGLESLGSLAEVFH